MTINACLMEHHWPKEYRVTLKDCLRRELQSGFAESQLAAEQILAAHKTQGLNTILCMSGGVDSEHMLNSFLSVSKHFELTIFRFKDGLNLHDIVHAEKLATEHNLKINYVDIDAIHFYETGRHLYWAHSCRCQSPQLALHLECLSRIDFGVPVMAWEPPTPWRISERDHIFSLGLPGYKQSVYEKLMAEKFDSAVPYFFAAYPEQVCAFFRTESYKSYCQKHLHSNSAYEMKLEIYRESGFPDIKPREKKTGFEEVKKYFQRKYNTFSEPIYDQKFRQPMLQINPSPAKETQRVSRSVFSHLNV